MVQQFSTCHIRTKKFPRWYGVTMEREWMKSLIIKRWNCGNIQLFIKDIKLTKFTKFGADLSYVTVPDLFKYPKTKSWKNT